jgi:hypothetical protein
MTNYASFVDYFKRKKLGTEPPIMTILSYLAPKDRVEILTQVSTTDNYNPNVYDKLILALLKNGEEEKADILLEKIYKQKLVDGNFYNVMKGKIQTLSQNAGQFNNSTFNYNDTLKLVKQGITVQTGMGIEPLCREFNQIMTNFCNNKLK